MESTPPDDLARRDAETFLSRVIPGSAEMSDLPCIALPDPHFTRFP